MRKIILIALAAIIILGLLSGLSWSEIATWSFNLLKIFFNYIGNLIGSIGLLIQDYIASLSVGGV